MNKKRNIINLNQENIQNETFEKETSLFSNHKKIQSSVVYPKTKFNMNLNNDINISKKLNFNTHTITKSNITEMSTFKEEYLKNQKNDLKYFPKLFSNNNSIDITHNNTPNIKLYNNINYNNLYFLTNDEIKDKSLSNTKKCLKNKTNKNIISLKKTNVYKRVIKVKK